VLGPDLLYRPTFPKDLVTTQLQIYREFVAGDMTASQVVTSSLTVPKDKILIVDSFVLAATPLGAHFIARMAVTSDSEPISNFVDLADQWNATFAVQVASTVNGQWWLGPDTTFHAFCTNSTTARSVIQLSVHGILIPRANVAGA